MRVDVVELFAFVHSWKLTRAYKVWYGSESNLIEQNVEQNCNDAGVGKPTYGVLKRKDFFIFNLGYNLIMNTHNQVYYNC